jgi:hypothetical protein
MRYAIATFFALSLATSPGRAEQAPAPAEAGALALGALVPAPLPAPEPEAPKTGIEPARDAGPSPVKTKWNATLTGFLQLDSIYDSTQSFLDNTGGTIVARPGTYAGDHDRMTFGFRNSRFGFRLNAPEFGGLRASGFIEVDFLGNQPGAITETAFWSNATMRARHVYVKVETDYVDLLFGQTWHLFGWQPFFNPNTAELQGVPGQLFTRSTQLRLSRMFKSDPVNVEVAVAAVRPFRRDAAVPDGQAGLRVLLNGLKAFHVNGNGGSQAVDPLAVGVSGLVRRFRLVELSATPRASRTATGWGLSFDGLFPIIPVTGEDHGNKLTLQGAIQTGSGFSDQYLAFTGGVGFPTLPNGSAFAPNADPGPVTYDAQGQLQTIDWTVFLVGLQYYFPPSGKVWIAANFSQIKSGNIASFGPAASPPAGVYTKEQWFDGCLFWQLTPAVRFGVEYAQFKQTYADGIEATNHRAQFSGWFLF